VQQQSLMITLVQPLKYRLLCAFAQLADLGTVVSVAVYVAQSVAVGGSGGGFSGGFGDTKQRKEESCDSGGDAWCKPNRDAFVRYDDSDSDSVVVNEQQQQAAAEGPRRVKFDPNNNRQRLTLHNSLLRYTMNPATLLPHKDDQDTVNVRRCDKNVSLSHFYVWNADSTEGEGRLFAVDCGCASLLETQTLRTDELIVGAPVIVQAGRTRMRALVESLSAGTVTARCVDYGDMLCIKLADARIWSVPVDYEEFPPAYIEPLAQRIRLYGVRPENWAATCPYVDEYWPDLITSHVMKYTQPDNGITETGITTVGVVGCGEWRVRVYTKTDQIVSARSKLEQCLFAEKTDGRNGRRAATRAKSRRTTSGYL
jgi:hypothetical protein